MPEFDPISYAKASRNERTMAEIANQVIYLPISNETDDTTVINTILQNNAGRKVVGRSGQTYLISAPIIVHSNTTLDMTGCTIKRITGTSGNLLRNSAAFGTGDRDKNITIIGGTWDKNATVASGLHTASNIVLHRIDGVEICNARFVDAGMQSKYAVQLQDVTRYRTYNLYMDHLPSDGVHVRGPAYDGYIGNIFGTTHDDFVAFTAKDYPTGDELIDAGGNIEDIVIENIYPESCAEAVKLLAGDGVTLKRATVKNVYGTTVYHGVTVSDDAETEATTGGWIDEINIENIGIDTGNGYGAIQVKVSKTDAGNGVGVVNISNVSVKLETAIAVYCRGNITTLNIRGLYAPSAHTSNIIFTGSNANIKNLSVSDLYVILDPTGTFISANGTIGRISVEKGYIASSGADVPGIYVGGSVAAIGISNITTLHVNIVWAQGVAVNVTVNDVFGTAGAIVYCNTTAASATIQGNAKGTITTAGRNGTPAIHVISTNLQANLIVLTKGAGDICYNTNSALSCGTGIVMCDGTTWKNLFSGATYA